MIKVNATIESEKHFAVPLELASSVFVKFRPSDQFQWSQQEDNFPQTFHYHYQLHKCTSSVTQSNHYYLVHINRNQSESDEAV